MAFRIVENQMMLTRPMEATSEKAYALSRQAVNHMAMRHEEEREVERELNSPQAAESVEDARVHDKHERESGRGSDGAEAGSETAEEPDEMECLKRRAGEKLLSLPVDRGRYARREERHVDITL